MDYVAHFVTRSFGIERTVTVLLSRLAGFYHVSSMDRGGLFYLRTEYHRSFTSKEEALAHAKAWA